MVPGIKVGKPSTIVAQGPEYLSITLPALFPQLSDGPSRRWQLRPTGERKSTFWTPASWVSAVHAHFEPSVASPSHRHLSIHVPSSSALPLWTRTSADHEPSGHAPVLSACNAGDRGSIPGLGRSPGEGNGNPLQYSCLENPTDRGAW